MMHWGRCHLHCAVRLYVTRTEHVFRCAKKPSRLAFWRWGISIGSSKWNPPSPYSIAIPIPKKMTFGDGDGDAKKKRQEPIIWPESPAFNRITQGPEQSTSPSCLVILSYFSVKLRDRKSGLPPGYTDAASAPSPNCPKYGTGGASNDVSFGFSKIPTAMIVTRPYLKRHMEKTSSTFSSCFSHDSDTMMHTPLWWFSSFFPMHYRLKSLRTRAIVITVIDSVRAQRCPNRQPPRPTSACAAVGEDGGGLFNADWRRRSCWHPGDCELCWRCCSGGYGKEPCAYGVSSRGSGRGAASPVLLLSCEAHSVGAQDIGRAYHDLPDMKRRPFFSGRGTAASHHRRSDAADTTHQATESTWSEPPAHALRNDAFAFVRARRDRYVSDSIQPFAQKPRTPTVAK